MQMEKPTKCVLFRVEKFQMIQMSKVAIHTQEGNTHVEISGISATLENEQSTKMGLARVSHQYSRDRGSVA